MLSCCVEKRGVHSLLLYLFALRGWIVPWALSQKLITSAKCVTLAILAKTPRKIGKCFPFAKFKSTQKFLDALKTFFSFSFVCFQWKITWYLGKVNKKVKTESQQLNWRSALLFMVQHPPLVTPLKRPIPYCCRICTILCMIIKRRLFIEMICKPLFTKKWAL